MIIISITIIVTIIIIVTMIFLAISSVAIIIVF